MYREHHQVEPAAAVPAYLSDTYWWAYIHPSAVNIFERQWLVNAILWGNFAKLRVADVPIPASEVPAAGPAAGAP